MAFQITDVSSKVGKAAFPMSNVSSKVGKEPFPASEGILGAGKAAFPSPEVPPNVGKAAFPSPEMISDAGKKAFPGFEASRIPGKEAFPAFGVCRKAGNRASLVGYLDATGSVDSLRLRRESFPLTCSGSAAESQRTELSTPDNVAPEDHPYQGVYGLRVNHRRLRGQGPRHLHV